MNTHIHTHLPRAAPRAQLSTSHTPLVATSLCYLMQIAAHHLDPDAPITPLLCCCRDQLLTHHLDPDVYNRKARGRAYYKIELAGLRRHVHIESSHTVHALPLHSVTVLFSLTTLHSVCSAGAHVLPSRQ
jgi:hypothetical protein